MILDRIVFIDSYSNKEYDTLKDFSCLVESFEVGEASPKIEGIEIPGTNIYLNFSTTLKGEANYNRRVINIKLGKRRGKVFLDDYSKIQNCINGKNMKIIHSRDEKFFWLGDVEVKDFNPYNKMSEIIITCTVDPYKYDIFASDEDWEWDTFDFEDGIINETKDLAVNEELEVVIIGKRKRVIPEISCSNAMEVEFNNKTYELKPGKQEVLDIEIVEGENKLKFIGNGTVAISYRGGSL